MTQAPLPANNRPENISQNPPAMYNASLLYNPPTLGYYWGWCAQNIPEELNNMLKEVAERTTELCLESFDAAIKGMGVREERDPERRWQLYKVKPIELWMEQKAKFPWRFERDFADFMKLQEQFGSEVETLPEVPPKPEPQLGSQMEMPF